MSMVMRNSTFCKGTQVCHRPVSSFLVLTYYFFGIKYRLFVRSLGIKYRLFVRSLGTKYRLFVCPAGIKYRLSFHYRLTWQNLSISVTMAYSFTLEDFLWSDSLPQQPLSDCQLFFDIFSLFITFQGEIRTYLNQNISQYFNLEQSQPISYLLQVIFSQKFLSFLVSLDMVFILLPDHISQGVSPRGQRES